MKLTLGHPGVTLASLWDHLGHLRATLDHFGVSLHFGSRWAQFGVCLASLWASEGHVGSLWGRLRVCLGPLWASEHDLGLLLG